MFPGIGGRGGEKEGPFLSSPESMCILKNLIIIFGVGKFNCVWKNKLNMEKVTWERREGVSTEEL
jgi:hypothetical protein